MTTPDASTTPEKETKAKTATVKLAVDGLSSDEHTWAKGEDPITREGTEVPASKAKQIIEQAAAGGVTIREVN